MIKAGNSCCTQKALLSLQDPCRHPVRPHALLSASQECTRCSRQQRAAHCDVIHLPSCQTHPLHQASISCCKRSSKVYDAMSSQCPTSFIRHLQGSILQPDLSMLTVRDSKGDRSLQWPLRSSPAEWFPRSRTEPHGEAARLPHVGMAHGPRIPVVIAVTPL